jgi:uncharacterized membrane protein YbhN (UPF0104 family)
MAVEANSDKVKLFLNKKLIESELKIIKMKRKQKLIKGLYASSIVVSVVLSSCAAVVTTVFGLPFTATIILTSFSATSAVTAALSTKFNLKGKQERLRHMVDNLSRVKNRLDYVLSCNNNLSQDAYQSIIQEFTQ